MGYTPKRTLYKLDFSRTEHAGLEVTTRSASLETLLEVLALADLAEARGLEAVVKQFQAAIALFAGVLVSWNVETDDGDPVPATAEGLQSQEPEFVLSVMTMWATEMTKAPPDLPSASSDGAALEASIPMSPSPPS